VDERSSIAETVERLWASGGREPVHTAAVAAHVGAPGDWLPVRLRLVEARDAGLLTRLGERWAPA